LRLHQTTRFPLQGAHLAADCSSCHPSTGQGSLQFVARSTECFSCHQAAFAATRNPDHLAAGFSRDCGGCHATSLWSRVDYNHDLLGFSLTGAHRTLTCDRCHAGLRFVGAPVTCAGCHQQDYDHTTSPNHAQALFPTDCASCHRTTSWSAPYDHNRTRFPLTGAHRAVTCQQCHSNGTYAGTPVTCVPCHQTDYNSAAAPNHQASGFSTDCQTCHTTTQWLGAKFDHNASRFPLTGAHRTVACQQCHGDGVYAGKPTTCVSCHQTDYDQTANPGHRAAGFPTDCGSCHTTTAWTGATFDHDSRFFRVYSGRHRGTWNSCADCHTNPANYQVYTCLTCHTRARTDGDHGEVSGYQYVSSECLRCHARV
jgi:hypothetical protein